MLNILYISPHPSSFAIFTFPFDMNKLFYIPFQHLKYIEHIKYSSHVMRE